MENKKVLVAMSGGVDSSVAAYILKQEGYSCVGTTMKLYNNEDIGVSPKKTCCSLDDISDARRVAHKLDIPFYVFNFTKEFKTEVINRFVNSYENGETPNPCIDCNRFLKFDRLYKRAEALGIPYVATGHYARIEKENERYLLKKALDPLKDQSYVLYSLTQEQLSHTIFPLGEIKDKKVTRDIAEKAGFYNAKKPDSQDICFVPNGKYAEFIKNYTGKSYKPGAFLSENGEVLGKHRGIIEYTVGQRKGLNIALGKPCYVTNINPKNNTVVLGDNGDLFKKELLAEDFNYIAFSPPNKPFKAYAKIRYKQPEQEATVYPITDTAVKIVFKEPQRAITKGQAVVLYNNDLVLGGGKISEVL